MLTVRISDLRKEIKSYFDKLTDKVETLIINRMKDTRVVHGCKSLCATQHELSSRKNRQRLDAAIEKMKSGINCKM